MLRRFKYDLAFSFAEEDRLIAESVASALRSRNFRSYYLYTEQQEKQLGKDLFEVTLDVYRNSRFIILICSKNFVSGYWSGIEQRAMTANFKLVQGKIFPIRTDETKLSSLPGSTIYEKWDNNPAKIAGYIINRVRTDKRKERVLRTIILILGTMCIFFFSWYFFMPPLSACKPVTDIKPGDPVMVRLQRKSGISKVEISSEDTFYLSNTEVTLKQYKDFCKKTGAYLPTQPFPQLDNNPVVNITWDEALAYCQGNDGRLPTEEEWEYVASAGLNDRYSGGNNAGKFAVYGGLKRFKPVGQKCPNALGIYDMSGNVAEWTSTIADSLEQFKIVKGGSHQDKTAGLLISVDSAKHHAARSSDIGFRIAWDHNPSK